jgi:ABC-type dipeptide/oligopeptide/nickel transport system permease component
MVAYILSRLARLLFVFIVVTMVAFLLMHNVPGGPFDEVNMPLSAQAKANILAKYGLDQPLHIQYYRYMSKAVQGDFGTSYASPDQTVAEIIGSVCRKYPAGWDDGAHRHAAGMFMGILAGVRQNTWIDQLVTFLSALGMTVPNFIISIWMILIFVVKLHWLPMALDSSHWHDPKAWIMPVIALGLQAVRLRITLYPWQLDRRHDIRLYPYCAAKGLSEVMVVWRHALKNALIPIITALGPMIPEFDDWYNFCGNHVPCQWYW